ncbi:hypothetical protein AZE42_07029 [Rhizopogon vesiculosus]|uniref:Uncharacterized protein n=1 Tax=Rhizopogon vesiculosus TaxID=180088 RepID=A0A1J8QG43_9AGAM|nr:hypothetical protein AZE42_07029 [Rhizopogon vesiculosus]
MQTAQTSELFAIRLGSMEAPLQPSYPRLSDDFSLRFHVVTAADTIAVIQHSEFPSLKKFAMQVDALPWAEAEQLFHSLSQCKACQTLEDIETSSLFQATANLASLS